MYQLKTRQICLFFIAFVPVSKLFILPSIIASISSNDMWISSLISFMLDLITIFALIFTCKKTKLDVFTLIENTFNKPTLKILLSIYALLFFLKAVLPVADLRNYVEITLYETIPSSIYFLPFFLALIYFSVKPLKILGRCADILWTFTLIGLFVIYALSFSNVDFSNLLPIATNPVKNILFASYKSSLWYGDAIYLAFFLGNFLYKKKDGVKIILSFLASVILTLIFMVFFYCIFTTVAFRQAYSLTEISKYSTVINNIGRFDYIGIAFILISNVISTCLPLYFCSYCISKIIGVENKWVISIIIAILLFIIVTFFREYFYSIETFITSYVSLAFVIFFNLLPILTIFLTKKEKKDASTKA